MKNINKLLEENIIHIALVFVILAAGLYFNYTVISSFITNHGDIKTEQENLDAKKNDLNQLIEAQKHRETKKVAQSGKVIYEVLGQQFSPEASFGIMFENILSNISNSGLRIQAIDYNYQPADDKIISSNAPGYNACELSFTTVSTYTQLQSFFKNITKETYLTNIREVYIEPYDRDKSILIAKFKIRLYTKTI